MSQSAYVQPYTNNSPLYFYYDVSGSNFVFNMTSSEYSKPYDVMEPVQLRIRNSSSYYSGSIQCNAGEDLTKGQNGIFLNSENGDIIIRARDGKIRLQSTDIELNATGNKIEGGDDGPLTKTEGIVWIDANETIKLDAKKITVDGMVATKILSTGVLTLDGKLGMQILSPIIHGATCATNPAKKPGKIR